MSEEEEKLFEKFDIMLKSKPSDSQAKEFFSKLSKDELDMLIKTFESNEIEGMPSFVKNKLVEILKKLVELKN
ncbi:MAG: hypothetical protein KAI67_03195 [Candidatus Pacebacteria bacterium]|nr:hypothetical protein [Candidatus Paceibacterota bacterium]